MDTEISWLWRNRVWINKKLKGLRRWLAQQNDTDSENSKGILILGPQGTGKSTLGCFLAGEYDHVLDIPAGYSESPGVEVYSVGKDEIGVIVAPGQTHRMDTWDSLLNKMRDGQFSGVILLSAFGYDSIGEYDYTSDPSWNGDKTQFVNAYTLRRRKLESVIQERVIAELMKCNHRIWLLHIINKQDLWWENKKEVEQHYHQIRENHSAGIQASLGTNNFRSELLFMSLVIGSFTTSNHDVLAKNVSGYEQASQTQSLRKLLEVLDALRKWEVDR